MCPEIDTGGLQDFVQGLFGRPEKRGSGYGILRRELFGFVRVDEFFLYPADSFG